MHPSIEPSRPTLVEVRTPTCLECRAMEPDLEAVAARHPDVDLVVVDASVETDWAVDHDVRGTPTLIGVSGGREVFRYTGRRTATELEKLFSSLVSGQSPRGVGGTDLALRIGAGAVLVAFGLATGAWPLITIGLVALLAGALPALRRR